VQESTRGPRRATSSTHDYLRVCVPVCHRRVPPAL
jgi:hypothetical protein